MPWSWYLFSLFSHCLLQKKSSITPERWQARAGEERRRVIWAGLCITGPTENFCNQLERLRFICLLTSAQLPTNTYSIGCYWPPSGSGDSIPVCLLPFKFQVYVFPLGYLDDISNPSLSSVKQDFLFLDSWVSFQSGFLSLTPRYFTCLGYF